jgi:phosphatidylinositol phospholipase C delta
MHVVDIWDGEDEPAIYHGHTLTSKVSLTDVARAISRYAFVASPYPVIISAEIHCGLKQQDQAAEIMRRVFGDALVTSTVDGEVIIEALPSPERLKHRILFKVGCYLDANNSE